MSKDEILAQNNVSIFHVSQDSPLKCEIIVQQSRLVEQNIISSTAVIYSTSPYLQHCVSDAKPTVLFVSWVIWGESLRYFSGKTSELLPTLCTIFCQSLRIDLLLVWLWAVSNLLWFQQFSMCFDMSFMLFITDHILVVSALTHVKRIKRTSSHFIMKTWYLLYSNTFLLWMRKFKNTSWTN